MMLSKSAVRKYGMMTIAFVAGTAFQFGFLEGCNDRLLGLTNFVDPCDTFLANCNPGDFQSIRADIGDFCVDPTCTVPGACDPDTPALGTQRDLCP